MTQNITLGPNESKLLLTLEEKSMSIFTTKDAKNILQTSDSSVRHILMDLARKRRLKRIERGKYLLVPFRAGLEGFWSEDPWAIVPHLIDQYYIGFWTAMNYWDMTEQIPSTVFVATTKRKRNFEFGHQRFQFVKLSKRKFFGFIEQKAGETSFNISSKEKTIIDGLMHPEYCGGIPEVAKAMWNSRDDVGWTVVFDMAEKTGVNAVIKRLGYLLSILDINENIVTMIKTKLKKFPYDYLDPVAEKKKIEYSNEFGLIINRTNSSLTDWRYY